MMKTYFDADCNMICELNAEDVSKLQKEYRKYSAKKGEIYRMDPNKMPSLKWLIRLTLGEPGEVDGDWFCPSEYRCTNKNVATRWHEFLKPLQYHDTFRQTYRNVDLEGNKVFVYSGDY